MNVCIILVYMWGGDGRKFFARFSLSRANNYGLQIESLPGKRDLIIDAVFDATHRKGKLPVCASSPPSRSSGMVDISRTLQMY